MDFPFVEDTCGLQPPKANTTRCVVPQSEVPPTWAHPELKRLRNERKLFTGGNSSRLDVVDAAHNLVQQRVQRIKALHENKKAQLEALNKKRDALQKEIDDEDARVATFTDLALKVGDQLIYQKATRGNLESSDDKGLCSEAGSTLLPSLESVAGTSWLERPSHVDGSLVTDAVPWPIDVMQLQWTPLTAHHADDVEGIREFVKRFAPIAEVNDEGRVVGTEMFSEACIIETPSTPCLNTGCRYQHLQPEHNALIIRNVLSVLVQETPEISPKQRRICATADFVSTSLLSLKALLESGDDDGINALLITVLNVIIQRGWYLVLAQRTPAGPGAGSAIQPAKASWAPVNVAPRSCSVLDRILARDVRFAHNDEKTAAEHIAFACAAMSASNASAEDICKVCTGVFKEAPLAVVWRVAAAALRQQGEHLKARWVVETAIRMFPVDVYLRLEMMFLMIDLDDDPVDTIRFVGASLDVLTNQCNALILSRQRASWVTIFSKAIPFMIAFTAISLCSRNVSGVTVLLSSAVEACGRYVMSPYALQNLTLLFCVLRGNGNLDAASDLPIASISDVLFLLPRSPSPALVDVSTKFIKRQLDLCSQCAEAGIARVDHLRAALRVSILRLYEDDDQMVSDTLSMMDVEPRTYQAEVWGNYFELVDRREGGNVVVDTLNQIALQPTSSMWLHLKLLSVLAQYRTRSDVRNKLEAQIKLYSKVIRVEPQQMTTAMVSDSQTPARLKISAQSWLAYVMMCAAALQDPRQSLVLLRAIPKSLLSIHTDLSIAVFYEKLSHCLREAAMQKSGKILGAPGAKNIKGPFATTHAGVAPSLWETFKDIVREELLLLLESRNVWVSGLDYGCNHRMITSGHDFILRLYRDLPKLLPASLQRSCSEVRGLVLEVAVGLDAIHPLLS